MDQKTKYIRLGDEQGALIAYADGDGPTAKPMFSNVAVARYTQEERGLVIAFCKGAQ